MIKRISGAPVLAAFADRQFSEIALDDVVLNKSDDVAQFLAGKVKLGA